MPTLTFFSRITILISLILTLTTPQSLLITSPQQLTSRLPSSSLQLRISPIGLRPNVGSIHGRIIYVGDACTEIDSKVVNDGQEEGDGQDFFIMVNDEKCMESVKAKNIGEVGAFAGIVKKNFNITAYDREISNVHIPIVELQPNIFDIISNFTTQNPKIQISSLLDFTHESQPHRLSLHYLLTPIQSQAYGYLSQLSPFIQQLIQLQLISFQPVYIFSSQQKNKQYLGCLSNGRYCPEEVQYQGRIDGEKIVSEGLKQIIIMGLKGVKQWFKYVEIWGKKCLKLEKLWEGDTSDRCSEEAMDQANIDALQIMKQFNNSFNGKRPQTSPNLYLQSNLQSSLQIPHPHPPILLLNQTPLSPTLTPQQTIHKICTIFHPSPTKQPQPCHPFTNPSLFTTGQLMIIFGIMINLCVAMMICCKIYISRRMKGEIKDEVQDTLGKYYRYMENFQENGVYGGGGYDGEKEVGEKKNYDGDLEYELEAKLDKNNDKKYDRELSDLSNINR